MKLVDVNKNGKKMITRGVQKKNVNQSSCAQHELTSSSIIIRYVHKLMLTIKIKGKRKGETKRSSDASFMDGIACDDE